MYSNMPFPSIALEWKWPLTNPGSTMCSEEPTTRSNGPEASISVRVPMRTIVSPSDDERAVVDGVDRAVKDDEWIADDERLAHDGSSSFARRREKRPAELVRTGDNRTSPAGCSIRT